MNDKVQPGKAALNEVVSKLKAEQAEKEEKTLEVQKAIEHSLTALKDNTSLAQMYSENAKLGADNLGGESPILRVHSTGKSSSNTLADGSEPQDGNFFYKPTGEEFDSVTCHILSISRGYRTEGMELDRNTGKKKMVYNQIIGGLIVDGTDYKPFIMYVNGLKLSRMWEFGKEAAKYTRARPVSIPMFALSIKLTTQKEKTTFGNSWVINFEILKDEGGFPILIWDEGVFQFLKDSVSNMEDSIESLIASGTQKAEPVAEEVTPLDSNAPDREYVENLQSDRPETPF